MDNVSKKKRSGKRPKSTTKRKEKAVNHKTCFL